MTADESQRGRDGEINTLFLTQTALDLRGYNLQIQPLTLTSEFCFTKVGQELQTTSV